MDINKRLFDKNITRYGIVIVIRAYQPGRISQIRDLHLFSSFKILSDLFPRRGPFPLLLPKPVVPALAVSTSRVPAQSLHDGVSQIIPLSGLSISVFFDMRSLLLFPVGIIPRILIPYSVRPDFYNNYL